MEGSWAPWPPPPSFFHRAGGPSWTVPGWGTGGSLALPLSVGAMGSGTIGGTGFSLYQSSAGLAEVWNPRWPHGRWVSCCPPKPEGETGPSCPNRQDLIQADLVLAARGILAPASVLLPQVPNRLWRPMPGHWQPGREGRWPVATGKGASALPSLPEGSAAADGCLEATLLLVAPGEIRRVSGN